MASALSIECAANCLLNSLDLTATLQKELDKLPALAKFEVFLEMSNLPALERGRIEVQRIKELTAARNDFVHPKITTIEAAFAEPQDHGHEWFIPLSLEGENWPSLKFPKRSMFWSKDSSGSALQTLAAFFKYVFVDIMKSDHEQLKDIFPSHLAIGDMRMLVVFEELKTEISSAHEYGADFSFLGLASD